MFGALPGERVRIDPAAALIRPLAVLEESPHRQTPPCRHAPRCGGCVLQHAAPDFLAEWKRQRVIDALAAQGLEAEVSPTISSPPFSRRRATFSAMRTKKTLRLGFHELRAEAVADIEACHVLRPEITAALPALRAVVPIAASRRGEVKLAATASEAGLDVALRDAKDLTLETRAAAAAWAEEWDIARLTWNEEQIAERRPPMQRFGAALVAPPPGGFLQATAEGEEALSRIAIDALKDAGASRVADLFSGCGTFALRLAEIADVAAFESDPAAVAALDRGWRMASGLRRVAAHTRDLFRRPLHGEEFKGLEAVLFDPPRAGAEAQVQAIAAARAEDLRVIIGVSCEPQTFARDARHLYSAGWRLSCVTPIDQFLWSPHIELIGVFIR